MVRRRRRYVPRPRRRNSFKVSPETTRSIVAFILLVVVVYIGYEYWKRPESAIHKRPKSQVTQKTSPKSKVVAKQIAAKPTAPKPQTQARPSAQKPVVYQEPIVYEPEAMPSARTYPPMASPKRVLSGKPAITFVLDDIGHTREHENGLTALGDDVTYAILPFLKHSIYFGNLSRQTGAEVILHLPLQSVGGVIPGQGLITTNMPEEQILELVSRDLSTVPNHVGVNNHMGSLGTSDPRIMGIILKELKRRNLFFLDSYTTPKTIALNVAKEINLPALKRDVFLDNEDSQPAILERVRELAAVAKEHGYAIGIGHYRYNTFKVLQEEIPKLKKQGFQIVSLTDLLRITDQKR